MKFFKPKVDKKLEAINKLRNNVLDCTFSVSEKIISTVESERINISNETNYGIKQEVLCFYLLYVDRTAMGNNDRSFYERLQDALLVSTCGQFVDMQFNTEEVKEGFDVEKWRTRMINENVDLYNESGENYSTLPLVAEEGLLSSESVLIKVVENIDGLLGREQVDEPRLVSEIPFWLIQTARDNQLVKQIDDLRKMLN